MSVPERPPGTVTRRRFLAAAGGAVLAAIVQACRPQRESPPATDEAAGGAARAPAGPQALPPTPACGEEGEAAATAAQTEGPYFTPNSPERSNFRTDAGGGTPLVVSGAVLRTDCTPVARALVDVWHADANGEYDNRGYRFRGHFFTGSDGTYRMETIVPGLYPGRTRHLHVKVQAPGGRVLTTQLYFPDEAANRRDGIFRPELNMAVSDSEAGKAAEFNFVLEV